MLTPRQEQILGKVVALFGENGQPVGSKTLATDPDFPFGSSTIRSELALLEDRGLLNHPHTSAGRVPTEAGHRYFVDHLLPTLPSETSVELELMQREVDQAMRVTSETLSAATNLLAVVSAPPVATATVRHVEVLLLQPQTVTIVVITSAGEVAKRLLSFGKALDPGLVSWSREYLNDRLVGTALGSRRLLSSLADESLGNSEREFLATLRPVFDDLVAQGDDALYVSGTARLLHDSRAVELQRLDTLIDELERRATMLELLKQALNGPGVIVRIGAENPLPALQSLAVVGAGYGLPHQRLGSVSVIGPMSMDYVHAIASVRDVALQLSRYVEDLYES